MPTAVPRRRPSGLLVLTTILPALFATAEAQAPADASRIDLPEYGFSATLPASLGARCDALSPNAARNPVCEGLPLESFTATPGQFRYASLFVVDDDFVVVTALVITEPPMRTSEEIREYEAGVIAGLGEASGGRWVFSRGSRGRRSTATLVRGVPLIRLDASIVCEPGSTTCGPLRTVISTYSGSNATVSVSVAGPTDSPALVDDVLRSLDATVTLPVEQGVRFDRSAEENLAYRLGVLTSTVCLGLLCVGLPFGLVVFLSRRPKKTTPFA